MVALAERGHVRAGETVLVEGTGGVALFGIQIAKLHGARVIVSGSANKLEPAVALGADEGIDRRQEDWVEAVLAVTGDRGVDHVMELVGDRHLGQAVQVTAVGGYIYQIGALDCFEVSAPVMPLLLKASPSTASEQVIAAPLRASSMRWTEPGSPRRSTPATRWPNCMRHLITSIVVPSATLSSRAGSRFRRRRGLRQRPLIIRIQCRRSSCAGELFDEQSESVGLVARA